MSVEEVLKPLCIPELALRLLRLPLVLASVMSVTSLVAAEHSVIADQRYELRPFLVWLEQTTIENSIPGGAVAIVSREGVSHLETFGVKNIDQGDVITADSIFRLASMSKTFAGTAAGLIVDQQLQSWDTPLADLFPGMKLGTENSSRSITLQQVVSHSTGLMPHSYSNMLDAGVSYDKIKDKLNQIPTVCAPGTCYGYQNVVFSLIGDVVELSTGSSYEEYLVNRLFIPLGMTTASVGLDSYEKSNDATAPHRKIRDSWRPTTTNAAYYTVAPASGVNASIYDMTLWVRANLGAFPDVLSPEQLAQLHEPVIATQYGSYFNRWTGLEKAYYATGWRVFDYKGLRAIHHGGGVRGYRSEMVFVPELNIGLVLMLNAESNLANDVVPAFLDNLLASAPVTIKIHND